MSNTVISYPIPAYQNVPIHPEYYQPRRFVITAITLGLTTTVTTSLAQDFVIGQEVRFIMPTDSGTRELNEQTGYIILINSTTQFVVDIASNLMTPFTTPVGRDNAQILPIGDINSGVTNAHGRSPTGTFILGSFINIS